jgi:hypothetical protein
VIHDYLQDAELWADVAAPAGAGAGNGRR